MIGRLTRKTLILAVGRGASILAQFAINVVLVRVWTAETFGEFHVVRVAIGVAALLDLGLPVGLLQATGGVAPEDRARIFRRGVSLALAAGIVAGLGTALAGLLIGGREIVRAMPWAGLIVAATIPAAALDAVLVVRDRYRAAGIVAGVSAIASVVLGVAALAFDSSVGAVYAGFAVAAVGRLIALAVLDGASVRAYFVAPWSREIAGLVRTSLAISANRLVNMASAWADRVIVGALFGAATLGVYAVGAWEVPFMAVFFGAITAAMVPELSEHLAAGRRERFLAVWNGAVARAAWVVFPIGVWAWCWAPELLRVLFTDRYEGAVPIFRAYLVMFPLRVAVFSALLVAMDATRALLVGSLIDISVNIVLSVALAEAIGPVGPALATSLGTWVQATFYLAAARRMLGTTLGALVPWGDLARAAAVALAAVAPTLLLRRWEAPDAVLLALAAAIAGGLSIAVIAARTGRTAHAR